ncbi:MAG: dinucleotide-utilizing enzyme involved in molybdopterin or thiamine biosynthesis [Bacteroidetes bacterium]|jgi:adenylyltransferase/sulfurtransferase|nr:dinucleotide-utilizing enzyme involved in molybdopterin or thiamine biosynthesis [Bacteroidota bacterium]
MNRHQRQKGLPGFSEREQGKMLNSRILVVGAGGLGCPVLLYLTAMGCGHIGIVDGDTVGASNLNRQVLFGEQDIGKMKADTAANYLQNKYSDIRITSFPFFLTTDHALNIMKNYDVVLDCTDNFSSRYMINDACSLLAKPLVFGAIYQHEGQVMVFHPEASPRLTYRDVYPEPPVEGEIPDCNTTGVLGVLPGLIGIMMATEAVKIISGFGEVLTNKICCYNISDNNQSIINIAAHPNGRVFLPADEVEFLNHDYSFRCSDNSDVTWEDVYRNFEDATSVKLLVDVREEHEEPKIDSFPVTYFPLSDILQKEEKELPGETLFVFCQSGKRSKKAVILLKEKFPTKIIRSVRGGIESSNSPIHLNYHEAT